MSYHRGSSESCGDVPIAPFDLHGLKTVELQGRPSKVFVEDLGTPLTPHPLMACFLDALPDQLAGRSLRRLCQHLVQAPSEGKVVACAIGGHVIKTGCGPYLIDLMQRGVISAIAMNGAAAIHDLELALAGKTSEDVGPRLMDGSFGAAQETADVYAVAAQMGLRQQIGLGRALGCYLSQLNCSHADTSVLVQAYQLGLPCTVHVAIGTDVVHMHAHVSGQALGASSMLDFRILTAIVAQMAGGLWLNLGCAVLLPEVFLKAVSVVRNFGHSLDGLVTANLDMIQQYRGRVNVCERPGEEGIALTGHHEIMIPLIHSVVVAQLAALPSSSGVEAAGSRQSRCRPGSVLAGQASTDSSQDRETAA